MTLILPPGTQGTDGPNRSDKDEDHHRVFVTNWWSPTHLCPHGATLKWRMFKSPDQVSKYLDGRRIDLFLMEDESLIARVFQWQAFSLGQMPDPQAMTPENLRAAFFDLGLNLMKSFTDAHVREVAKPRELKIGHTFCYLQIVMHHVDPRTALAGQAPPIQCIWWEVTPTEVGVKAPVIQAP